MTHRILFPFLMLTLARLPAQEKILNPWLPASSVGDVYLEQWPELVKQLKPMVFQSSFRMPTPDGSNETTMNPYVCQFFDGGQRVLVAWGLEAGTEVALESDRYESEGKPAPLSVTLVDGKKVEIPFARSTPSKGKAGPLNDRIRWIAKIPLSKKPCLIRNTPRGMNDVPNSLLHNQTIMLHLNKMVPMDSSLRTAPFYSTVWESWGEYYRFEQLLLEDVLNNRVSMNSAFFLLQGFDQSRILIAQEGVMWMRGAFSSYWLYVYNAMNLTDSDPKVTEYVESWQKVLEPVKDPSSENTDGEDSFDGDPFGGGGGSGGPLLQGIEAPAFSLKHILHVLRQRELELKDLKTTTPQAAYLLERSKQHQAAAVREIERKRLKSAFCFAVDSLATARATLVFEKAYPGK